MRKGLTVLIVAVLGVFAVKSVIAPGKMGLSDTHPDAIREPLSEWAGGDLHTGGQNILGMSRGLGMQLAKPL